MKFLNFNKVLCLSPHPDDVEYSMSGTIAKFKSTTFDVYCLTNGTSTDSSTNKTRLDEVQSFWLLYNVNNVNLILPEVANFEHYNTAEWTTCLDHIKLNGYDAVCTTSPKDSHQEHIFVNSLATSIARNSCLSIIEYRSPSTLHSWIPNYFVDINKQLNCKISSLQSSFISQMDSIYFSTTCIHSFHTDYNCLKRNLQFVEQFKIKTLYN